MKIAVIGQAPGPSGPDVVLGGRCGQRLADLCGLSLERWLDTFERANLVPCFPGKAGKGDAFVGREEARRLAEIMAVKLRGRTVVLLGFNVAAAFRLTQPAFRFCDHWEARYAFSPHPSGVSLWWNDPLNEAKARRFWRTVARE